MFFLSEKEKKRKRIIQINLTVIVIISDLTGALIGSIVLGPAGAIPYAIVGSVTETVRQIDEEMKQ